MVRRSNGQTGPGLARTMARTAVVAGTATVVAGSVADHQQAKQQARRQTAADDQATRETELQIAELQAQMALMKSRQAQTTESAAPAAAAANHTTQLQQLAQMKESGLLSGDQFEAAKSKLLTL